VTEKILAQRGRAVLKNKQKSRAGFGEDWRSVWALEIGREWLIGV